MLSSFLLSLKCFEEKGVQGFSERPQWHFLVWLFVDKPDEAAWKRTLQEKLDNYIQSRKVWKHKYQLLNCNYFKSRMKWFWHVSLRQNPGIQCLFSVFIHVYSVPMNPCRVLVSILGASPVLCMLLVPQEAYSKYAPFICFMVKIPEEDFWQPWFFSQKGPLKIKEFKYIIVILDYNCFYWL